MMDDGLGEAPWDKINKATGKPINKRIEGLGYKRDMQYKMQFEEEQKQQSALSTQVGGDHYKKLKIEPTVYCQNNGFRHGESSAIKYISRYHVTRNPVDLDKAIHFLQIVKEIDNA